MEIAPGSSPRGGPAGVPGDVGGVLRGVGGVSGPRGGGVGGGDVGGAGGVRGPGGAGGGVGGPDGRIGPGGGSLGVVVVDPVGIGGGLGRGGAGGVEGASGGAGGVAGPRGGTGGADGLAAPREPLGDGDRVIDLDLTILGQDAAQGLDPARIGRRRPRWREGAAWPTGLGCRRRSWFDSLRPESFLITLTAHDTRCPDSGQAQRFLNHPTLTLLEAPEITSNTAISPRLGFQTSRPQT